MTFTTSTPFIYVAMSSQDKENSPPPGTFAPDPMDDTWADERHERRVDAFDDGVVISDISDISTGVSLTLDCLVISFYNLLG